MAGDPGVDLLGGLRSTKMLDKHRLYRETETYPAVKSYLIGAPSATAWGPEVGGKNIRTGAV